MPPSRTLSVPDIVQAFIAAQKAGADAARVEFDRLQERYGPREQYDLFGGATLTLEVSSRSSLYRNLVRAAGALSHMVHILSVSSASTSVALAGMTDRQEQIVRIAAEEAALEVLRAKLGVDGYVSFHEN